MKRISTDAEYLNSGKLVIDADGIPVDLGYRGTGSPEGKVAAPVGSIYTDTAATTGAIRWIKTSGTGNTGWRVEYGDTGWRDVSENILIEGVGGEFFVRRVGNRVDISIRNFFAPDGTSFAKYFFQMPVGFSKTALDQPATILVNGGANGAPSQILYTDKSRLTWLRRFPNSSAWPTSAEAQNGKLSFFTDDAWPTSLPGTPA